MTDHTYWHKQTTEQPLYQDLLWSKPENKAHAGKLLIVGGNLHSFAAPAEAYQTALTAGAGTIRVVLPDALRKTIGKTVTFADFLPSTPSGSFSQKALAEILEQSTWADTILLAGDFGRNSETAILIEKLLNKYRGKVVITKDAIEYVASTPDQISQRPDTTLVLSLSQLQRLLTAMQLPKAVTLSAPLMQIVDVLHEVTLKHPFNILTKHHEYLLVAVNGNVTTTAVDLPETWCAALAAKSAVWLMQNPTQVFEALTVASAQ